MKIEGLDGGNDWNEWKDGADWEKEGSYKPPMVIEPCMDGGVDSSWQMPAGHRQQPQPEQLPPYGDKTVVAPLSVEEWKKRFPLHSDGC